MPACLPAVARACVGPGPAGKAEMRSVEETIAEPCVASEGNPRPEGATARPRLECAGAPAGCGVSGAVCGVGGWGSGAGGGCRRGNMPAEGLCRLSVPAMGAGKGDKPVREREGHAADGGLSGRGGFAGGGKGRPGRSALVKRSRARSAERLGQA